MSANEWGGFLVESQAKSVIAAVLDALRAGGFDGVEVHFTALKRTRLTWAFLVPGEADDVFGDGCEAGARMASLVAKAVKARTWCLFNNDYAGTFAVAVDRAGKRRWLVQPERDEALKSDAGDAQAAAEDAATEKARARALARAQALKARTAVGRVSADLGAPLEQRVDLFGEPVGPGAWRARRTLSPSKPRPKPAPRPPPQRPPEPIDEPEADPRALFAALDALGLPVIPAGKFTGGPPEHVPGPGGGASFVAAWDDRCVFETREGLVAGRPGGAFTPLPVHGVPIAGPRGLAVFSDGAVEVSTDGGASFQRLVARGLSPQFVRADRAWWFLRGGVLVSLTAQGFTPHGRPAAPALQAIDLGDAALGLGLRPGRLERGELTPSAGLRLAFHDAGVHLGGGVVFVSHEGGVLRSEDGGRSFAPVPLPAFTRALAVAGIAVVSKHGVLWAFDRDGRLVFEAPDGGAGGLCLTRDALWAAGPGGGALRWPLR